MCAVFGPGSGGHEQCKVPKEQKERCGTLRSEYRTLLAGLFTVVCVTRRLSPAARSATLWWLVLAGLVPALSTALGMPGMIAILGQSTHPDVAIILKRFTDELAFRHTGTVGTALTLLSTVVLLLGVALLPRAARWANFTIVAAALLGPLAANAVFVYPRYFLHVAALLVPCAAWLVSARVLRARRLPNLIAIGALGMLYVSTQPWHLPQPVDLRGAAALARAEQHAYGSRFAVDTFISTGVRFYNGSPGRIVNTSYPIPPDVERVLAPIDSLQEQTRFEPEFAIERRLRAQECDVVLLRRRR